MALFQKGHRKLGGRKPGGVNKSTAKFKEAVEAVFQGLGGVQAMLAWAAKSEENLKVFYSQIYPKLAPLQLTGANDGAIKIESIKRVIVEPAVIAPAMAPVIDAEPVADEWPIGGKRHWSH